MIADETMKLVFSVSSVSFTTGAEVVVRCYRLQRRLASD